MSRCACRKQWRGILPIAGHLALIVVAMILAYECGRWHRSATAMGTAALERVEIIREPEWKAAEPDHEGER